MENAKMEAELKAKQSNDIPIEDKPKVELPPEIEVIPTEPEDRIELDDTGKLIMEGIFRQMENQPN